VNPLGKALLPGSGLTKEEYGRIGRRDLRDERLDALERRALADDDGCRGVATVLSGDGRLMVLSRDRRDGPAGVDAFWRR
jgi:hypothetical protein